MLTAASAMAISAILLDARENASPPTPMIVVFPPTNTTTAAKIKLPAERPIKAITIFLIALAPFHEVDELPV